MNAGFPTPEKPRTEALRWGNRLLNILLGIWILGVGVLFYGFFTGAVYHANQEAIAAMWGRLVR